ncbi:hypothetical protein [Arthrobacter humicola]
MNVELSGLIVDKELGRGGFGVVHRVLGSPVAGDPRPMVFKCPKPGLDPAVIPAVLEGMRQAVQFRDALDPRDRQEIDEIAVWPVAMVTERGREVGCLLPLIPPEYFMDIPAKGNFPEKQEQRVMGYLAAPVKARNEVGYDSSDFHDDALRLHLLSKLAGAIELLHRHGLVFGDLNPKNEVFTFESAGVLLLDCDAVAHISDGSRASRQGHFPRWTPPEMNDKHAAPKKLQDFETDVYKLGLAFVRFIEGAPGATQRMVLRSPAPSVVTPQLSAVIGRALDPIPSARPNARELRQAAEDAVRSVVAPPVVTRASLNKLVTLRGRDVMASWSIRAGSPYVVEISGPGGQRTQVPAGVVAAAIRVTSAGPVSLHVRTKYASVTHLVGEIDCYELPPFNVQIGMLAVPQIPKLPAFTVPSILRREIEVPLPAWPVSMQQLTDGFPTLGDMAPSEAFSTAVVDALRESGIPSPGADLVGPLPLPDMLSLGPAFITILEQHFAASVGANVLPNAQALAYTRLIQRLTERVVQLEAGKP